MSPFKYASKSSAEFSTEGKSVLNALSSVKKGQFGELADDMSATTPEICSNCHESQRGRKCMCVRGVFITRMRTTNKHKYKWN